MLTTMDYQSLIHSEDVSEVFLRVDCADCEFPPVFGLIRTIQKAAPSASTYPRDPSAQLLRKTSTEIVHFDPDWSLATNGLDEAIDKVVNHPQRNNRW